MARRRIGVRGIMQKEWQEVENEYVMKFRMNDKKKKNTQRNGRKLE